MTGIRREARVDGRGDEGDPVADALAARPLAPLPRGFEARVMRRVASMPQDAVRPAAVAAAARTTPGAALPLACRPSFGPEELVWPVVATLVAAAIMVPWLLIATADPLWFAVRALGLQSARLTLETWRFETGLPVVAWWSAIAASVAAAILVPVAARARFGGVARPPTAAAGWRRGDEAPA